MTRRATGTMAAVLMLGLAAPLSGQEAEAVTPAQVQELVTEGQRIQERLAAVQQEALADPVIAERRAALGARVEAAMTDIDPELEERLTRAQALESELQAAQEAGDSARLQELIGQARELEQRYLRVQQEALQDEELSRTVLAFNQRVEARMTELDPETPELIERLREIEARLRGVAN